MAPDRGRALAGGVLYLVTFVTSVPAAALYAPLLAGEPADPTAAAWSAVLEVALALACIGTAVVLLPLLRPSGELGAIGFVAARTLEAAIILIGVIAVLSLATLIVGMVGIPLLLASATASVFGALDQTAPLAALLAAPIALWELSLGVGLIVRGVRRVS
jgi:hypothetical protein